MVGLDDVTGASLVVQSKQRSSVEAGKAKAMNDLKKMKTGAKMKIDAQIC